MTTNSGIMEETDLLIESLLDNTPQCQYLPSEHITGCTQIAVVRIMVTCNQNHKLGCADIHMQFDNLLRLLDVFGRFGSHEYLCVYCEKSVLDCWKVIPL